MENASKALLIAGAVLLVILIISLSVFIFNKVQSPANEARVQMSEEEILMFNSQFTKYAGKNVSAMNTKNLISAIRSNNAKYEQGKEKHIEVQNPWGGVVNLDMVSILPNSTYNISVLTDENTGLVNIIIVGEENQSSQGVLSLLK